MAYLTARELQWAGNQFGTGVWTTEDVEAQYARIDRERADRRYAVWFEDDTWIVVDLKDHGTVARFEHEAEAMRERLRLVTIASNAN